MNRTRVLTSPAWLSPSAQSSSYVRDPDATTKFYYDEFAESLYRYLRSVYGEYADDAEDVTHETFIRLFEAVSNGAPIERPDAWLFTVARRLMLDRIRHRRHQQPFHACDVATDGPAVAATQENDLIERERYAALENALGKLSRVEQECLRLRAGGLTLREIGAVVGLNLRRVSEVLDRATKTLHRLMREWAASTKTSADP